MCTVQCVVLVIVDKYMYLHVFTGMDDLVEVTGYLKDLNKPQIYNLGLVLGLDYCHVVDLRDNCGCNQYFLDAVVVRWLQRVDRVKDVSWTALITALQNDRLRQTGIADKIAAQHGIVVYHCYTCSVRWVCIACD